eukprot:gene2066-biopygen1682
MISARSHRSSLSMGSTRSRSSDLSPSSLSRSTTSLTEEDSASLSSSSTYSSSMSSDSRSIHRRPQQGVVLWDSGPVQGQLIGWPPSQRVTQRRHSVNPQLLPFCNVTPYGEGEYTSSPQRTLSAASKRPQRPIPFAPAPPAFHGVESSPFGDALKGE